MTRTSLLDAAERLFQQNGVSRTSLANIARAAGVTRGAVYWHFKDKADLFGAMLERVTSPLDADMAQLLADGVDPLRAWRAHVQRALHQIVHDAQTRRVLQIAMQKVEHADEMGPVVAQHIDLYQVNVNQASQILSRAAQARGQSLPAPATELARSLHALLHGLIYAWLLAPHFDLEHTAGNALAIFLRGMGFEEGQDVQPPAHQS